MLPVTTATWINPDYSTRHLCQANGPDGLAFSRNWRSISRTIGQSVFDMSRMFVLLWVRSPPRGEERSLIRLQYLSSRAPSPENFVHKPLRKGLNRGSVLSK